MLRRAETPLGHPFQLRFLRPLRPPCHLHRRAGRERPSRTSWSGPVFAGGVMQLVGRYRRPVPSTFPTSSTSATSSAAVGSRPRRRHLLGDASRVLAPGILALSFCRIPSLSRASLGLGERRRYRISPYGRTPCLGNPYVSYVSYVVGPEMSYVPCIGEAGPGPLHEGYRGASKLAVLEGASIRATPFQGGERMLPNSLRRCPSCEPGARRHRQAVR